MKIKLLPIFLILATSPAFSQYISNFESFKGEKNQILKNTESIASLLLNDYDIKFYFLDLTVTNISTYISGNVIIKSEAKTAMLDTFAIELNNPMQVDSVYFNGENSGFSHLNDLLTVIPFAPPTNGELFSVQIWYHGTPVGSGVSNDSEAPGYYPYVTWNLSECFHAKEWFPCKQDLQDKADSCYVFLTTDQNLKAGSNGILTNVTPVSGNKFRHEWKCLHPIDYYLISFAVSEYVEYNFYAHPAGFDSILVQNYVYLDDEYTLEEVAQTDELIELFSELFGIYPFHDEKYGHCMAPLGGAMEHQTMTTIVWNVFWIIAHELGHQWFGDYVTCATWQDIWINEGFASYTEYLSNQYLVSQAEADQMMLEAHDAALTKPEGSVYIPFEESTNEGRIFSWELSYRKGASLLHMIRFETDNDSVFFHALKEYVMLYANSNATGLDFKSVIDSVTGMDFTQFFDQWYFGKGFPTFDVLYWQEGNNLKMQVEQTGSSLETPLFITPVEYRIYFNSGQDTTIRVFHDEQTELYTIPISEDVTGIEVDPDDWLLNAEGTVIVGTLELALKQRNIKVFPNPCNDHLTILLSDNQGKKQISISDISGKILNFFETGNAQLFLDISKYPPGFYTIAVENSEGKFTEKFVKQ
ncbi:MAG: T9SS type A sorting domain-containing protein [Bacteroidia bacterium]|nr:T9SS type A sorting domain-containing protein [Bacteroidia bacterium]